jgi:hypothetical protein
MNKIEIAPGIVVFDGVFLNSNAYLEQIESDVAANKISWVAAGVLHDDYGKENVSKKARDTDYIGLPNIECFELLEEGVYSLLYDFSKALREETKPALDEYFNEYYVAITTFEPPQLLRYGNGQHFHNHIDDHPELTRRVSFSYYINDNYEGGEIEFPRFNVKIKPKANQLVVFPSGYVYNHIVHPVTSGVRYAVVQWIA